MSTGSWSLLSVRRGGAGIRWTGMVILAATAAACGPEENDHGSSARVPTPPVAADDAAPAVKPPTLDLLDHLWNHPGAPPRPLPAGVEVVQVQVTFPAVGPPRFRVFGTRDSVSSIPSGFDAGATGRDHPAYWIVSVSTDAGQARAVGIPAPAGLIAERVDARTGDLTGRVVTPPVALVTARLPFFPGGRLHLFPGEGDAAARHTALASAPFDVAPPTPAGLAKAQTP
ncbi:MAG: hypothetical protein ACE5IK_08490 [Acidobacteriota bacterium]